MADLGQLGSDLQRVDRLIVDLVQRRMDLARLVGFEKLRTHQPMFRANVEDQRLDEVADYARSIGVNPHLARTILYTLINESCKQQTIQMQDSTASDLEMLEGDARFEKLRANLMRLTEAVAPIYDDIFYGGDFFARTYAGYEEARLKAFVDGLGDRKTALDLGCGTGRASIFLASRFESVTGLDISQHMVYQATLSAERGGVSNVEFVAHDVESGLPYESDSVSLVNMNYGAASDFVEFETLVDEVWRVLRPGGGLFLSFYNKDALSRVFGFLPWRTDRAAVLNPYTNCLEVSVGGEQYSVHAKPYTIMEVAEVLGSRFRVGICGSFPLFCTILPPEVFETLAAAEQIADLDRQIERANGFGGTYLVCEATKSNE